MSALTERLRALIATNGPISVSDYMAICLFDPEHGYYTTREPFGQTGDFTTAPEISQMFGELIGAWAFATWQALGAPLPVTLAEIGPGRGTLMKDALRTLNRLQPGFIEQATITLVETSPRLRAVQRETLASFNTPISWHDDVAQLPKQPLILIGNELFDAVPIRQYVKLQNRWHERLVGLDEQDQLTFIAGPGTPDAALLPADAEQAPDGAIVELAPARSAIMAAIAQHLATHGGAGLFLDYGYLVPAVGDTLQALRKHAFADVLAKPGEADLTAHVDFAALAGVARSAGLEAHLTTQGDFLLALGLLQRAGQLGASLDEAGQNAIRDAVERLAGPDQMGDLFKVLAVTPPGLSPAGFARERPSPT
ncbi:class I SAM-dependent methyltransferase [Tianweitania sp. BSSL-BM11]|uniref:Class I SAM-dependent methyltransferase n=1 Tax=Tianweitania aestuarii TaxID=2814886 RepID=A0ABS5RXU6_9HYPH|nr:class I SAM-dependent methyltransferase [Tianweitania aestuarii]MBS9721064.1 class I SAM-dependent methyltransferase [Tianweitania aestuarii]